MASLTDRLENSLVVPSCRRRWIDEDCGGSGGAENHVFPGGYSRAANHFESRVFCRRAVRKSRRDPLSLPPFSDLRPSDSWLDHEGRARVSPVECRRNEVFHPFVPLPPPSSVCPPRRRTKPRACAHRDRFLVLRLVRVQRGDPFQWRPAGTNV